MGYMNTQNNQFDSAGPAALTRSAGSQCQAISALSASQFTVAADIPATKVEAALGPSTNVKIKSKYRMNPQKLVTYNLII
jgi:hypothetical protein